MRNNLSGMEETALQSVLAYYLFSNGLQKLEKKKKEPFCS